MSVGTLQVLRLLARSPHAGFQVCMLADHKRPEFRRGHLVIYILLGGRFLSTQQGLLREGIHSSALNPKRSGRWPGC